MTDREHFVLMGMLLLIVPVVIATGCTAPAATGGTGYLEGVVTIGPLCPVEPCHITREQQAAAYAARHLVITGPGQSPRVYNATFSPGGYYRIELPYGRYLVEISKNGIDRSPDVPKAVEIGRGATVMLNISIDTGIR